MIRVILPIILFPFFLFAQWGVPWGGSGSPRWGGNVATNPCEFDAQSHSGVVALWMADSGVTTAGSTVSSWIDRVNSLDADQATTLKRPTQNAFAERVIRTIKDEEIYLNEYPDYQDAYQNIGKFIDDVYAQKRIHSSLGYLTPKEFEQQWYQENQMAIFSTKKADFCVQI